MHTQTSRPLHGKTQNREGVISGPYLKLGWDGVVWNDSWDHSDGFWVSWILISSEREREIKFIGLFENRGHRGPYSPYKPFNHNLYIGIIIFPHIDNPQYTGYD